MWPLAGHEDLPRGRRSAEMFVVAGLCLQVEAGKAKTGQAILDSGVVPQEGMRGSHLPGVVCAFTEIPKCPRDSGHIMLEAACVTITRQPAGFDPLLDPLRYARRTPYPSASLRLGEHLRHHEQPRKMSVTCGGGLRGHGGKRRYNGSRSATGPQHAALLRAESLRVGLVTLRLRPVHVVC
jgi:hypothetical protein